MQAVSHSWTSGDVHAWDFQISTFITSVMHLGRLGFLNRPQLHPSKKERMPRCGLTAYDFSKAIKNQSKTQNQISKVRRSENPLPRVFRERERETDPAPFCSDLE